MEESSLFFHISKIEDPRESLKVRYSLPISLPGLLQK